MCVGLSARQRAEVRRLAKAGDALHPAGVKPDNVHRPGLEDTQHATGVPFPLAIGDADAGGGAQGAVRRAIGGRPPACAEIRAAAGSFGQFSPTF